MSNENKNDVEGNKFNIKMYVSLALYALLGLAIGYGLAKAGSYIYSKMSHKTNNAQVVLNETKSFTATATAMFEGEHTVELSVQNLGNLNVAQGEDVKSRYFYVTNASGTNLATMYLSYEGGRGYTAADYLLNTVAKAVKGLTAPEAMNHASSTYLMSSSASTEWHVKPSDKGSWLIVIESAKANKDSLMNLFESLELKEK